MQLYAVILGCSASNEYMYTNLKVLDWTLKINWFKWSVWFLKHRAVWVECDNFYLYFWAFSKVMPTINGYIHYTRIYACVCVALTLKYQSQLSLITHQQIAARRLTINAYMLILTLTQIEEANLLKWQIGVITKFSIFRNILCCSLVLYPPGAQPIYIYLVRELCSARSQMVNISGFVGHRVSIVTTRLCRCRGSIHKQYGKAWAWLHTKNSS